MKETVRPSEGDEFNFFREAEEIREPSAEDIRAVVGVYRALKRLSSDFHLDALTLRCFDLVLGEKTTGCFALSRLADEGITAACEGDVPSTLALLWTSRLLGTTAWMANPARADAERGRLLLAHCTVPRSLVGGYTVRSHFESGLGAGIAGELKDGEVTLVRIGGARLDRLWTAEGEIISTPREEGLCRTQAEIALSGEAIRSLLSDPLGNHLVLVGGHHAADFIDSFALFPHSRAGGNI
jgi:L-fucose isomerase-like protein